MKIVEQWAVGGVTHLDDAPLANVLLLPGGAVVLSIPTDVGTTTWKICFSAADAATLRAALTRGDVW